MAGTITVPARSRFQTLEGGSSVEHNESAEQLVVITSVSSSMISASGFSYVSFILIIFLLSPYYLLLK